MGCNHRRSSDPGLSDHPFAVEGPFLATPLDGDVIEVPDHPLVRAIFGALMSAGVGARTAGWHADAQGATTIQRIGLYPIRVTLEANHAADAWRAVEEISPLILDVLVLLLACDRPTASARLLRSADVLKLKGCRRFGDERRILEEQVSAQIHLLRRLSIAGELLFKLTEVSPGAHVFVHEPQVWLQELYLKAGRKVARVDQS